MADTFTHSFDFSINSFNFLVNAFGTGTKNNSIAFVLDHKFPSGWIETFQ